MPGDGVAKIGQRLDPPRGILDAVLAEVAKASMIGKTHLLGSCGLGDGDKGDSLGGTTCAASGGPDATLDGLDILKDRHAKISILRWDYVSL
jgi:hypothetical protein